ncbi:MAG TPA: hypothetical protein VK652_17755 [Steroidobacteraceae bacterium]|nr:hypothetical protein [Steroidobacteraceae bacterium]
MKISTNSTVMGQFTISRRSRIVGWLATWVMGTASVGFIGSLIFD